MTFDDYITLSSMLIMTFLVLVQMRGATIGAGLGSSGEINTERRGSEKTIFFLTIFFALVFVISLLVNLLSKK
ncbi:MAG TPA: preprotein translocase subunit SecG [Candidatus Saccharimonadales bacterium]|jgi:preprotein translocase subunit SecG|nr:preprotein translocase subunit SecG [Candidatus Saccharimonadales bacterium]